MLLLFVSSTKINPIRSHEINTQAHRAVESVCTSSFNALNNLSKMLNKQTLLPGLVILVTGYLRNYRSTQTKVARKRWHVCVAYIFRMGIEMVILEGICRSVFLVRIVFKFEYIFDVWVTVHRSSMWNKISNRCHIILYLFGCVVVCPLGSR